MGEQLSYSYNAGRFCVRGAHQGGELLIELHERVWACHMAQYVRDQQKLAGAGRAMNNRDMQKVLHHLRKDPVVKAVYDAKSEEIGPNIFRFKAEIGQPPPPSFLSFCVLPC